MIHFQQNLIYKWWYNRFFAFLCTRLHLFLLPPFALSYPHHSIPLSFPPLERTPPSPACWTLTCGVLPSVPLAQTFWNRRAWPWVRQSLGQWVCPAFEQGVPRKKPQLVSCPCRLNSCDWNAGASSSGSKIRSFSNLDLRQGLGLGLWHDLCWCLTLCILNVWVARYGALTHGTIRAVNPIEKVIVLRGELVAWLVGKNDRVISLAGLNQVRSSL